MADLKEESLFRLQANLGALWWPSLQNCRMAPSEVHAALIRLFELIAELDPKASQTHKCLTQPHRATYTDDMLFNISWNYWNPILTGSHTYSKALGVPTVTQTMSVTRQPYQPHPCTAMVYLCERT